MNYMCHAHFAFMEERMSKTILSSIGQEEGDPRARTSYLVASLSKHAVLRDHGFSFVTCADWLWELIGWCAFALVVDTLPGYAFVSVWFVWHAGKARERHRRYTAEYQLEYPAERTALIPYLL